jgi:NitT/TauT family transport system substrate-binding protein
MTGMIRKTLGIAILLVVSTSTARAQQLRIAIGAVSVAHLPGIVALEGGYFARQNLQPELIMIRGGPQTVAALLGGDVAFAQVFSVPLVSAKLGGADPVIVAGLVNEPLFSLMTVPSIEKPADLRGKTFGITTFGSASDIALRLALPKWGLKPETDAMILQVRGIPEILTAMQTGAVHAGMVSPPTNVTAMKAGFRELAFLPKLGISFQHTTLSTTRRYLAKNRDVAVKTLRAYANGIRRIKTDKPFTMKALSKYFRTNDQEILESTYNSALAVFREIPYPTLQGIQSTLDFLGQTNPKAKQAKPAEFVDGTMLEEIEKSGL